MLDGFADRLQPPGRHGAVDDTVVVRQRCGHSMANFDGIAPHHRLLHGSSNGEDRAVGWIDDGSEMVNAEHPQVGDGEGGAFHIFWR